MKVICIDASSCPKYSWAFNKPSGLIEGNIYTVIKNCTHPYYQDNGYILQEIKSDGYMGGFLASRFAPLSTIDETELLEQRDNKLIYT